MTTADDVRRVALALPRTHEQVVRGRAKLKVRQIVYAAFSRDEQAMGFAYPKDARDGLVASDPETFFLPPTSDLRYQWVCAHLPRLGHDEMRELVTDGWRMCVPRMLHELPELPAPTARAWHLMEQQDWGELRGLLHPRVRLAVGETTVEGRRSALEHLQGRPTPRPPASVEVRDGQIRHWVSAR